MGKVKERRDHDHNEQSGLRGVEDAYEVLLSKLQKTTYALEQEQVRRIKEEAALKESHIETQRLFENMDREKDERIRFFSLIAHDLRSPLATLQLYLEVSIECFDDMDRNEIMSVLLSLKETANNISLLTDSLLKWTMHKLDKFECEWAALDLKELIDKNIDLYFESCKHKGISLISGIGDHIEAYADYDMIDAALRNFLSNAVKYTNEKGTIRIDAKPGRESITLSIADSGVGMDEERLNQLFDKSKTQMLSHTGTEGERGSGMGLLLCKELVEKSGGKIRIESKVDDGTTIFIELLRVSQGERADP
jgi:signal transduction histidine kinase